MTNILNEIYATIKSRKNADIEKSYVASLLKSGNGKICKKIGEESTEVVIAALNEGKKEIINESADLIFHLLVLLFNNKITPDEVLKELEKRLGTSGIDEKARRTQKKKGK